MPRPRPVRRAESTFRTRQTPVERKSALSVFLFYNQTVQCISYIDNVSMGHSGLFGSLMLKCLVVHCNGRGLCHTVLAGIAAKTVVQKEHNHY